MTIALTMQENLELWAEAEMNSLSNPEPDESICQFPRQRGTGYRREIEVYPDLWLTIMDVKYRDDDILLKFPESNHPLQFGISVLDTENTTFISGAGVQRAWTMKTEKFERDVGINIHMPPELLGKFFPTVDGEIPSELSLLAKGDDWQTTLYPKMTPAIRIVAQQIINCPYQGTSKRMFLQTKVQELIGLQLMPILVDQSGVQPLPRLKSSTIASIHHAKDILLSHLENPPSILELSQMVGVSDRTLQRGFQELFGTKPFNYLTEKRMEWAEQLLRHENMKIVEVAHRVGYSEPRRFAEAFKRRFGITPSQCLGKKSVSGT